VTAIADRLPRKRGRRTAVDELLYYAWKIGTVGVLPALAAGKGFGQAAQESFLLLKQEPKRVIGIRMGYSLLCWIIGVVTYVAAILYFVKFGDFRSQANQIYDFYVLMALPLLLSVGVIMVMIRPFYLIMIANVYTGVAEVALPLNATQSEARGAQLINLVALFFSSFFAVLIALTLLGDDTGLQAWIESLAQQDLKALGRGR
jgi:hypothetical protein